MRVYQVDSITLSLLKSNPPQLLVEVNGTTTTPGWKDIHLATMEKKLSKDGILDLELAGTPPDHIVPQVLRPVTADLLVTQDVEKIVGVMVHARSNKLSELLGAGGGRPQLSHPGPTTLAVGEEKNPVGEKLPMGETTWRFGEEKAPFGEKSPFAGEEKFPGGETTMNFGEETDRFGETGFVGETFAGGETLFGGETDFTGESGPVGIETDPGIETDKLPQGEDFDDVFRSRIRTPFNRR